MPLRLVDEFETYLEGASVRPHEERVLEVSWAMKAAIPALGFAPRDDWHSLVVPTPLGARLLALVQEKSSEASPATLAFCLLRLGCYYELLVDAAAMDDARLRALLEQEQQSEQLRWPHRWGRALYDKFHAFAEDSETSRLSPVRTNAFLEGTPLGIHQYGRTLLGPLGVMVSQELRHLYALRELPLWHCSDTGCLAPHEVQLTVEEGITYSTFQTLIDEAETLQGPDHAWTFGFAMAQRRKRYKHVRRYWDLPALLVEGLTPLETKRLARRALRGDSARICREALSAAARHSPLAAGATDALIEVLDPHELVHLMLVLEDRAIAAGLDECAREGDLDSATYGRRTRISHAKPVRGMDAPCELSRLGIRAADSDPCPRLVRLIFEAYRSGSAQNALGWRIDRRDGAAAHSDVMEFVIAHGPRAAIEQLILSDIAVTQHVARALWLDLTTLTAREDVVERILWKCGFYVIDSAPPHASASRHLEALRVRAEQCSAFVTESDREALRGCGVNAFVGVESELQRLVAWNVWLLASDHFVETRFTFDESAAMERVALVLGPTLAIDGTVHHWSTSGRNTLGCSLAYLGTAAKWWSSLPEKNAEEFLRPAEEMPHYEGSPHVLFPFRHRQLWADCSPPQLSAYLAECDEVVAAIHRSDAASVRNGLDHWRRPEEFPAPARIAGCAKTLEGALARAYEVLVLPTTWWVNEIRHDFFNRVQWSLEDSRGRHLTVQGPTQVAGLDDLAFGVPYIVVGRNLLGLPNATLRFDQADVGAHQRMWADYPLRREIPRRGTRGHATTTDPAQG